MDDSKPRPQFCGCQTVERYESFAAEESEPALTNLLFVNSLKLLIDHLTGESIDRDM
jgi:hypothetical protein